MSLRYAADGMLYVLYRNLCNLDARTYKMGDRMRILRPDRNRGMNAWIEPGPQFAASYKTVHMSHAFVRERDEQWLHEVPPTVEALIVYLTRENNGLFIYDKKRYFDAGKDREIYEMSDGLRYAINDQSQWYIVD